jgi:hypothetical protein
MRRLLFLLPACHDLDLSADLDPPRVLTSSLAGPRTVEVPVRAAIDVYFSEPIDPASLVVALVPWTDTGSCTLTPGCDDEDSTCERGRCQRDPLRPADLARTAAGAPPDGVLVEHVLLDSPPIPASHLRVTPARALTPTARHSLLVFARDRSGAPLVDASGAPAPDRRDLVTAPEGSSGPEARLVSPPPGALDVPPNIAHVDTEFVRPVLLDPAATLELTSDDHRATLREPTTCPGWVPGLCLRWRLAAPLRPGARYQPAGGDLRDLLDRPAIPPAAIATFVTAAADDTTPPILAAVFTARGPCVYADLTAAEPLALDLVAGDVHDLAVTGGGPVRLAVRLADLDVAPGDPIAGVLIATDLADNRSELPFTAVVDASYAAGRPPLGLAEILANPRGAEPRQEFVELADPRPGGSPAEWPDLFLADLPWPDVSAALAAGDDPPGDPLPAFHVAPGARVVVVASGFDPDAGDDPAPAPGTVLLRVDASIGAGGLKNAGEPLTLYAWSGGEPALLATYGDFVATDAPAHAGRSVVADPAACDLPRAWGSHPYATSAPGYAP